MIMKTHLLYLMCLSLLAWATPAYADNLLENGDFKDGTKKWNLELHQGANATFNIKQDAAPDGLPAAEIQNLTEDAAQENNWFVQFFQAGLKLQSSNKYKVTFLMKSEPAVICHVNVFQATPPFESITEKGMMLDPKPFWKEFEFVFIPNEDIDNARLLITGLNQLDATFSFADFKLEEVK